MIAIRSLILAAAGSALCVAAAQSTARADDTPRRGGTALFVLTQDPQNVNPDVHSSLPNRITGCTLFQGLIQATSDYRIAPLLAKSWAVSPDGLTYSFELNKVEWHDSKPLTSDDVKYTLLDVSPKYSSIFAPAGRQIEAIDTPAPDKVVIHLKQPFGPFLISLACHQGGAILPAHIYRGTDPVANKANTEAPIGSGPFKLVEWKHGDHLRFTRNPAYFEPGKPYLDEIIGKVVNQSSAAIQALKAGEVDLISSIAPSDQSEVRAQPKLKIVENDMPPVMSLLFFNMKRKPFDDVRVRDALFMAIDRDYLIKNAFFNHGSVGLMPFTTLIPWSANNDIDYRKIYPFDPAKANALLDEAGVKRGADGKRLSLRFATYSHEYPEFQPASMAIKSMWQAIGVDVSIEGMETATLMEKVHQSGDFDVAMENYNTFADPALGIARMFISSSIGKVAGNASTYSNPRVDDLFRKGEQASDTTERAKYYREVQTILAADLPTALLRQYRQIDAASIRLKGLWGVAEGNGRWADAWLAE